MLNAILYLTQTSYFCMCIPYYTEQKQRVFSVIKYEFVYVITYVCR